MTMTLAEQDALNRQRLEKEGFDRNFLVSAGAGAGKTYTTVERVFNMLCDPEAGIRPQDIVMITFTIRAANEMKTRLSDKIRREMAGCSDPAKKELLVSLMASLPEMQISTIHSFCRRILNDYPLESGVGFAPQYESEDSDLKTSALTVWAEKAWKGGMSAAWDQKEHGTEEPAGFLQFSDRRAAVYRSGHSGEQGRV